ncbi:MAG: caspase family protein [Candidatus Rokubacteria bacterium]|nr:caspase family protein [Candidatus Rokubacteria bacterium]
MVLTGLALLASSLPAVAQKPRAERPTYTVGEKWLRADGEYELIRIEKDLYIFSAGAGREIHLTKDLALVRVLRGGKVEWELSPSPKLGWPLEVGKWGMGSSNWYTIEYPQSIPITFMWKVEAYEDVDVGAGRFKAFRIVQAIEGDPIIGTHERQHRRRELVTWYAPETRQFVKAEGPDVGALSFEVVAISSPATAPLQVALSTPKDQERFPFDEIVVTGRVTAGKGVARVTVTLNGQEVSRQEEPTGKKDLALNLRINLKEGRNVLVVAAADSGGETRQEVRTIFHDRPPPAQEPPPVASAPTATPPPVAVAKPTAPPAPAPVTPPAREPSKAGPQPPVAEPTPAPEKAPEPEAPKVGAPSAPTVVPKPAPPPVSAPAAPAEPEPPKVSPPPAVTALPPFQITLSTPRDQARVDRESIALAGLVSSGKGVSRVVVTLNGVEVSRLEERAAQRTLAVNLPLKLREGENTLVVTATDSDGTTQQEIRTVHYEKVLPLTVAIRYPEDRARVAEEASVVAAAVSSSKGVARVSVTLNGVEVFQQSEPTPRKSVAVTVPVTFREGPNAIVVSASEPDGTVRQEIRTVFYDRPKVAAAPPVPAVRDRWAVVVGVGAYESPGIPRLRYAIPDAEAIYQVLTGPAGVKKENVLLLTDRTERKPTLRNLRWALGTLLARRAKKDDLVIVFFAGHGAPEVDPRGIERDGLAKYLVPIDADPDDLYATALPMDEFQTIFGRLEAERVVVFLDTCYSGAAGGRTFVAQKTRAPNVDDLFLERLTRSKGRAIITASRPAEVSLELPELGHGIFTYYLVRGLQGAGDLNRDGIVSLQELYEYVEQQVTQKSRAVGGNQHPMMKGELEGVLPLVKVGQR